MACIKDNLHDKETCYVYYQSSEPVTMQLTVQAVTTDCWFIYPSPKPHTFTRLGVMLHKAFKIQASNIHTRVPSVISSMAVLIHT